MMAYDENNIPTRISILSGEELSNDRVYQKDKKWSVIPAKFKQVVEVLSIFASSVGIASYIYANIEAVIPPEQQGVVKLVLFIAGIFGGYRIAKGQQMAFKSLRNDWFDKDVSSTLLLFVWLGIILFDTYIMGMGAKVSIEYTYEMTYKAVHAQQHAKELSGARLLIENQEDIIKEAKDDRLRWISVKSQPKTKEAFEANLKTQIQSLKLSINRSWDKKVREVHSDGHVSKYKSERIELNSLRKKRKNELTSRVKDLTRSVTKEYNRNRKNVVNNTRKANNELENANKIIEEATVKLNKIKIPVMIVPPLRLNSITFFIVPFVLSLFLSLVELWIDKVLKSFNTSEKTKVTKIRNGLIRDAGYDPDVYDNRHKIAQAKKDEAEAYRLKTERLAKESKDDLEKLKFEAEERTKRESKASDDKTKALEVEARKEIDRLKIEAKKDLEAKQIEADKEVAINASEHEIRVKEINALLATPESKVEDVQPESKVEDVQPESKVEEGAGRLENYVKSGDIKTMEVVLNYYREHDELPLTTKLGELIGKSTMAGGRFFKKYPALITTDKEVTALFLELL